MSDLSEESVLLNLVNGHVKRHTLFASKVILAGAKLKFYYFMLVLVTV